MDISGIAVGLGTGAVGVVLTWLRFGTKDKAETRKTVAETSKIEAEATEVMIRNLEAVIVRCENEIKRMEGTIVELRTDLYKAQEIIRNYGGQNMDNT